MTGSRTLDDLDAAIIKALINAGWMQSDIASLFQCNGGRVAEINRERRFGSVRAANLDDEHVICRLQQVQTDWLLRINTMIHEATRRAA